MWSWSGGGHGRWAVLSSSIGLGLASCQQVACLRLVHSSIVNLEIERTDGHFFGQFIFVAYKYYKLDIRTYDTYGRTGLRLPSRHGVFLDSLFKIFFRNFGNRRHSIRGTQRYSGHAKIEREHSELEIPRTTLGSFCLEMSKKEPHTNRKI